jgi:transposase InsO family protein
MRQHGLEGRLRGRSKRTTLSDEAAPAARDLLECDFTASAPNEKWVADLIYVRTFGGFLYLAFILDCYSRLIVGWRLASHMRAQLVLGLGRGPSRASSSTGAGSPPSSRPSTRSCAGSASTTRSDCTRRSLTWRPGTTR